MSVSANGAFSQRACECFFLINKRKCLHKKNRISKRGEFPLFVNTGMAISMLRHRINFIYLVRVG